MIALEPSEYTELNFVTYDTLEEKLQALLSGEILYIKKFEKREGGDVLVRLEKKKHTVSQISFSLKPAEGEERFWVTYNIGINDLSLFTCFKFEENTFNYTNKFMINDVVFYESEDGRKDTAIVEGVYVSIVDPDVFAYKLSRDDGIYAEEDLTLDKYM
ncbi:virion structural protein [Bacillus phage SIOphi]|uniref:Uncharacterized protein n=1 Tax=Bacillus phage SIOphi TaxID=1285382 RepID=R4JKB0_9CAUD|nr:virion structural protein [Bacillus phage SIOphi]AGK86954.1 hypothetical protein SIOphi_00730 [Bacillus phage SIOphi]